MTCKAIDPKEDTTGATHWFTTMTRAWIGISDRLKAKLMRKPSPRHQTGDTTSTTNQGVPNDA
jgi:hypothetical protein